MIKLSKEQIDELTKDIPDGPYDHKTDVLEELYIAIGLNADGTPMPPPGMLTTQGWAVVDTQTGELAIRIDAPDIVYAITPSKPLIPDHMMTRRRIVRVEIREINS